jgi:hypothetical protein
MYWIIYWFNVFMTVHVLIVIMFMIVIICLNNGGVIWLNGKYIIQVYRKKLYIVFQEECARLQGGVQYVKVANVTQNTFVQSWTVTEIMAREIWNFDRCYTLVDYQIHIKTGRNMWFL